MQFDDRLATVLRMQAGNERAMQTQFRQLLDLAGSAPEGVDEGLIERAFARLGVLSAEIAPEARAAMIREPGMRLRNPALIAALASQELPVASAAMATARPSEAQWAALIPELPIPARALLRHRQDLPAAARKTLAQLGIGDLVLPEPDLPEQAEPDAAGVFDLDPALQIDAGEDAAGIGALVRRIEAFQRARRQAASPVESNEAPRLPLGEQADDGADGLLKAFDFTTDAEGRIDWADAPIAPMAVGMLLASQQPESPVQAEPAMIAAMRRSQPVHSARLAIDGAPAIAGEWRVDAAPHFTTPGGRFAGYRGRMRRPAASAPATAGQLADGPADRMRQVIHELRTPVNAIQGFAEIIQQQLFGPTPNEYRALAATIAGDAARMLAGFEELDRLVKLETGALELEDGVVDFRGIVAATAGQLDGVLRPRSAGLELLGPDTPCPVALARGDAEMLAWRIMATLAGAISPGEELQVALTADGQRVTLELELPASLSDREDLFDSAAPSQAQAITSGMFGAGFTLRLARAEARAAGGDLVRGAETLRLALPFATGPADDGATDIEYDNDKAEAG